jgi:hypothetical protein
MNCNFLNDAFTYLGLCWVSGGRRGSCVAFVFWSVILIKIVGNGSWGYHLLFNETYENKFWDETKSRSSSLNSSSSW